MGVALTASIQSIAKLTSDRQHKFENMAFLVTGVLVVLAGFVTNLMLGAFYSFGNLMPYMASYMRNHTDPDLVYK
jgi:hypothetical protein